MNDALTELTAASTAFVRIGEDARLDARRVVVSWPAVPVEIIRAAGLEMVLAPSDAAPTPAADAVLEPGVFPSRLRQLVEAALTGRLAQVAAIVVPRTSDCDYKTFLYLREFSRLGQGGPLPPVLLLDLLLSPGPRVAAHDRARFQALLEQLARIGGRQAGAAELEEQIVLGNRARAAGRSLQGLRHAAPRIAGSEAMSCLSAFWQLEPQRYAGLVDQVVLAKAAARLCTGSRVLLAGAPVDAPALHAGIESLHGIVVDEVSACGHDAVAEDVAEHIDPMHALAQHYRQNTVCARMPVGRMLQRIAAALDGIDAVVFSQPPDDATFGWDYPRLRGLLGSRGIPHLAVGSDPCQRLASGEARQLKALFTRTTRQPEARHG